MPTLNFDLAGKTDLEVGDLALAIINATDGKPKYAAVQTLITALKTASGTYATAVTDKKNADDAAQAATTTKNDARGGVEAAIMDLGNGMISLKPTPLGDADVQAAGFNLRAANSPIGQLAAPIDFLATMGDDTGEMDLTWSAVKGRRFYDVEYRLATDAAWTRVDPSPTKSKVTVHGLQSGKLYVFRVRAVGTAGPSPWSDVSEKMAP